MSSKVAAWVAVALALRLPSFLRAELWLDERISVDVALAHDLWAAAARFDLHPPLFAALLAPITTLTTAPWAMRLLPLLASLLAVPLAGRAAAAWGEPRAAGAAMGVVALAGPWGLYGGEARPYALGALLTLAVLADLPGRPTRAAAWASVAALTLYPAGLVTGALLLSGLASDPRSPRRWLGLVGFAAVALILGLTLLPQQLAAHGADLTTGHLARFLPSGDPVAWVLTQPLALVGWSVGGVGGLRAVALGAVALALLLGPLRGRVSAIDGALGWAVGLSLVAACAGLQPLGATRHVLPLAAVLGVGIALRSASLAPRWAWIALGVLAVGGRLLAPGLP